MFSLARQAVAGTTAVACQVLPAATWLPAVRDCFPRLAGVGRLDHVALTFDDGPDPVSTPAFLDLLRAYDARATFFVVGERAAREPRLVRRIVDEGHELGLHGWHHRYTLATSPRLGRAMAAVADAAGVRPIWFRPPYGVLSATSIIEARRHRLTPILWTTWAKDWRADATADSVWSHLESGLVGGATVLLHDAGNSPSSTAWRATLEALPRIFRDCASRGLSVGPLAEHDIG